MPAISQREKFLPVIFVVDWRTTSSAAASSTGPASSSLLASFREASSSSSVSDFSGAGGFGTCLTCVPSFLYSPGAGCGVAVTAPTSDGTTYALAIISCILSSKTYYTPLISSWIWSNFSSCLSILFSVLRYSFSRSFPLSCSYFLTSKSST